MKITIKNGIEDIEIFFKQNNDSFFECYKSINDINNFYEDSLSAVVNGFVEYICLKKGDEYLFDKDLTKDIPIIFTHHKKYQYLPLEDSLKLFSLTNGRLFEIYKDDKIIVSEEKLEELESRLIKFELKELK